VDTGNTILQQQQQQQQGGRGGSGSSGSSGSTSALSEQDDEDSSRLGIFSFFTQVQILRGFWKQGQGQQPPLLLPPTTTTCWVGSLMAALLHGPLLKRLFKQLHTHKKTIIQIPMPDENSHRSRAEAHQWHVKKSPSLAYPKLKTGNCCSSSSSQCFNSPGCPAAPQQHQHC
jgi:hypothetical protein